MDSLGRFANKMLHPLGLRLGRASILDEIIPLHGPLMEAAKRHSATVTEVEAYLRERLFTEMRPCPGRAELMSCLNGTSVIEAMYLIDCLHRSLDCAGDICEFGVAQGATSALIANEIRDTNKQLWLFDSFEGLPAPTEKDELIDDIFGLGDIRNYEGQMAFPSEVVQGKLSEIGYPRDRTNIVAGFVDDAFLSQSGLPAKICFAYVDFDFYAPILSALRFLRDRMAVGTHVLVDDYNFFSSGAKTAVDEFVQESKGAYDLVLPHDSAGRFCILRKTTA